MESVSTADAMQCGACSQPLEGAVLMTCLHALCRHCEPAPSSAGTYVCPACALAPADHAKVAASTLSDRRGSRDGTEDATGCRIAARPCLSLERLRRRRSKIDYTLAAGLLGLAESLETENPEDAAEDDDEDDDDDDDDDDDGNGKGGEGGGGGGEEVIAPWLVLHCSQHPRREADQFCLACHQLSCAKCLTTAHRKCARHLVTCAEAVCSQRPLVNSLHAQLSRKVVTARDAVREDGSRLHAIEEQRKTLIGHIAAQREALVRALLEKERRLVEEVNAVLDREVEKVKVRADKGQRSARAAEGQLAVLEAVMSVRGEAEILPLVPPLHQQLDAETNHHRGQSADTAAPVNPWFEPNKELQDKVDNSPLGEITRSSLDRKGGNSSEKDESDLRLTLLTSFHARTREDSCDPLLTDLLLLPTGDVITTDRDNKCVKKFNGTGHLLTRVPMPEVPCRLALVSQGKAAIAVTSRKLLFFLSLLGTVRILSSVKVKKFYCFLASAGPGLVTSDEGQGQGHGERLLLAATNHCDVIDVITESGVLLRRLWTYRGDKVSLSRPLYLHAPLSLDPEVAALAVDSGRRLLFALTSEGETTFTFRPRDENGLECPLGVGTTRSGLILLADRDRNRLLLLGKRGAFLRDALGEKDGLHKPCALHVTLANRMALTQVDGWVKVYKLE